MLDKSAQYLSNIRNGLLPHLWASTPAASNLLNRKWLHLLIGGFVALLVLWTSASLLDTSVSPRAVVGKSWQKGIGLLQSRPTVDALRDYRQSENCTVSSNDLHVSFKPLCTDRQSLVKAMSGGGRIGFDAPYQTRGCDMRWFTTSEICDILHKFDRIHIIGDSMMRHLAQAFQVFLREDLIDGGRATWLSPDQDPEGLDCRCRDLFLYSQCAAVSATDSVPVFREAPESIRCKANQRPAPIFFSWLADLSTDPGQIAYLQSSIANRGAPNGREVFIMGHGGWTMFAPNATVQWLANVEAAIQAVAPVYFEPEGYDKWPRLYLTPTAQGKNKPSQFTDLQNNIRLAQLEDAVTPFVTSKGYDHLGLYNLTIQSTTPDSVHATMENNLMKAQMVLNWLNTL